MAWAASIAGAVTVAVTARLMYLVFLGGRSIREATLTGRFVGAFRAAALRFANAWGEQRWGYKLVAYPCMVLTMGAVSALMYWLMPLMEGSPGAWNAIKYCALIFLAGVPASIAGAFFMIFAVYFAAESFTAWIEGKRGRRTGDGAPPETVPGPDGDAKPGETARRARNAPAAGEPRLIPPAPSPDR